MTGESGPRFAAAKPVVVLLAAGGAAWEAGVVAMLASAPGVVLLRRCLDLNEALATAATGAADAVVVASDVVGLDSDAVGMFARHGVGVLAIADGDEERLRRLGVTDTVGSSVEASALVEALVRVAAAGRGATPTRVESAVPSDPEGESDVRAGGHVGHDPGDVVDAADPVPGRLVVVWGPHGGAGRTSVAINLAADLARRGHGVFLLDSDPYGGAVAQHLAILDDVSGLLAAARSANAGLLDPARLATLARQAGPRLRVLTGLPRTDRWTEVRLPAYAELLAQARSLDAWVVVDAGPGLAREPEDPFASTTPRDATTTRALEEADVVVVVGAADPVGLTRLTRSLLDLGELRPRAEVRVVVNRMRRGLGWTHQEVCDLVLRAAPGAAVTFLPEDQAAADRALLSGRSLTELGDSSLRTALASLTTDLVGAAHGSGSGPRGRRPWRRRQAQTVSSR